jgi:hypothetical protein
VSVRGAWIGAIIAIVGASVSIAATIALHGGSKDCDKLSGFASATDDSNETYAVFDCPDGTKLMVPAEKAAPKRGGGIDL